MKALIQIILKFLAKAILAKYNPEIVGITGSVGKTSVKEAIFAVLSSKYKTQRSLKNYNNEIGLPLAIIGAESPGRNILGWPSVFLKAFFLILSENKNYPNILALEMGVDRPGDMDYLLGIVKCKIGVITGVGHSHLEFFDTIEKIKNEKEKLIISLPVDGWAILNHDDARAWEMFKNAKAKVLTYGLGDGAQIRAVNITNLYRNRENYKESGEAVKLAGVNFKLIHRGSAVPVFLPRVLGKPAILAALAGAAAGIAHGMNLVEISEALKRFKPPVGRMNLIPGIKNTLIVDDTYNASPQSALVALEEIGKISLPTGARRFAVLGDMLELGSFSEAGHRQVGREATAAGVNKLIVAGERARDIGRGAREAGMSEDNIFHFADGQSAGLFAQERIKEGDIILVKGSQGMRMERIVKELMADPLRAEELLVRQGEEWS